MKIRPKFEWPADKAKAHRRAIYLEWLTIGWMLSIVLVLYLTLGNSQAMRTAWFEDMLGILPAVAFLVAARIERWPPDQSFPFGYYRSISIAYLVSAAAILGVGGYLLYESALKLIMREHPTIGLTSIFGYELWMGWLMIAALTYSIIPPVVLGRMKMPVARDIHDKVLVADASMQKADWMTGVAAIIGIIGIGFGFWWADATAAGLISLDIVKDGGKHLWRAAKDLADESPRTVERADPHPSLERAREAALSVPWVKKAELHLREEGHLLSGSVFVVPAGGVNAIDRLHEVRDAINRADWRVHDPDVCLVTESELSQMPGPQNPETGEPERAQK